MIIEKQSTMANGRVACDDMFASCLCLKAEAVQRKAVQRGRPNEKTNAQGVVATVRTFHFKNTSDY